MTKMQSYSIDILNILPDDTNCFIQAPNLMDLEILKMMQKTEFEYYKLIKLTDSNKKKIIEKIATQNIVQDFQSIEIRDNTYLLFEGYDSMEYGTISKRVQLPNWFVDKYIKGEIYNVSTEW